MCAPARNDDNSNEMISSRTKLIVVGLIAAIIGSVIASSYAKATLTNYAGFVLLLGGIAIFIFGICATACVTVNNRFSRSPIRQEKRINTLSLSVWAIGVGIVLSILGFVISSGFAKNSLFNLAGFGTLLTGICFFVLGVFGTLLGIMQERLSHQRIQGGLRVDKPRFFSFRILSIGVGLVFMIVGSIVAGAYAKETTLNFAGFGLLLAGVAILTLGMSGTAVSIVKSTWKLNEDNEAEPGLILASIWGVGIGATLIITGSLIAGSYAKNSLMNYSGFGMLLTGTGVFVYGLFETVRLSAMGYLSGNRVAAWDLNDKIPDLKNFWSNMVKSTSILNLAGVMTALGLLFFSLWQLDLIVSGPVWWSSLPNGAGYGWSHLTGAYADDPFQCFLWKTTVGQAYDTLFMLIFISFMILFVSAFFWPRSKTKKLGQNNRKKYRNSGSSRSKMIRNNAEKKQSATVQVNNASKDDTAVSEN